MSGARWSRTLLAVAVGIVLATSALRAQTQVKAILFDSYGTLVSWEGVEEAVAQVFRRKGVNTDPAAFNQLWRSKQLVYIMYNTLVDNGFEPFSFGHSTSAAHGGAVSQCRPHRGRGG